jgi:hypothetical protein
LLLEDCPRGDWGVKFTNWGEEHNHNSAMEWLFGGNKWDLAKNSKSGCILERFAYDWMRKEWKGAEQAASRD